MTYVITRSCVNDTSCVSVCPVNCIHPAPDEPDYATAEMLYIDPDVCIECGACMDACPVSAIYPDYELPESLAQYEKINAAYYEQPGATDYEQVANSPTQRKWDGPEVGALRVAIVGSGPSACYTAQELLDIRGLTVEVDMFERLPAPFGLVRYGIAPDHQDTKVVTEEFSSLLRRPGFRIFLNTEVGRDVSVGQLTAHYDAVVYAFGAMRDRHLNVPGEDLPGSHAATEFVAWYNGHPDFADREFDLSGERAVIIGNGNVALDVARILTSPIESLERTDIAQHALEALRDSAIREVVVIGRRGLAESAFSSPELLGLINTRGVAVRVEGLDLTAETGGTFAHQQKLSMLRELDGAADGDRTVTLRFLASPHEVIGTDRVSGIRLTGNALVERDGKMLAEPTGTMDDIESGLVLRSIGYHGSPLEDLPFDAARGTIPNENGRVIGDDAGGAYVVGWIKRGPSGVVGTNRQDARGTVDTLLADLASGRIHPRENPDDIASLLPDALDAAAWRTLDRAERAAGRSGGRPRLKIVRVNDMVMAARGAK